jgi:hypothetical protein
LETFFFRVARQYAIASNDNAPVVLHQPAAIRRGRQQWPAALPIAMLRHIVIGLLCGAVAYRTNHWAIGERASSCVAPRPFVA